MICKYARCGADFVPINGNQLYCSPACRVRSKLKPRELVAPRGNITSSRVTFRRRVIQALEGAGGELSVTRLLALCGCSSRQLRAAIAHLRADRIVDWVNTEATRVDRHVRLLSSEGEGSNLPSPRAAKRQAY
jgi:hypothetical protein